jgi:hypothetical protein
MVQSLFRFDWRGYHDIGAPTDDDPIYHDAGEQQLLRTYQYFRDIIKFNRKPRLEVNQLALTSRFIDYLNIYHFACANIVAFASVYKLALFNEAFQNMNTYLPDKMVRLQRLWARLSAIVVPDVIKLQSIQDGLIVNAPGTWSPHIRLWTHSNLVMYGNIGDYDEANLGGSTTNGIYQTMATAAEIDSALDDLQSAIEVLEGNMAAGADRTDVLGIKEVYEYISTVENFSPKFSQKLPDLMGIPAIACNRQLLNDWYCRGFECYDTKGVSGDEVVFFPVAHMDDLGSRIPLKGWGSWQDISNFTLMGMWKFASCVADAIDGTYVDGAGGTLVARLNGTTRHEPTAADPNQYYFHSYTREDGHEYTVMGTTDFGDGAGIRAFFNSEDLTLRHIYNEWMFAAQLVGTQEFHFLDRIPTDYEIWMEPDHFPEQYAIYIAQCFGVPYLV